MLTVLVRGQNEDMRFQESAFSESLPCAGEVDVTWCWSPPPRKSLVGEVSEAIALRSRQMHSAHPHVRELLVMETYVRTMTDGISATLAIMYSTTVLSRQY